MILQSGNGFYVWKIKEGMARYGGVRQFAEKAASLGLKDVIIKMANGTWKYNLRWDVVRWVDDILPPMVEAFRDAGIFVSGFHYVYGNNPDGEASVAVRRIQQFDLDAWVIDAETEYKRNWGKAPGYIGRIRSECPDVTLALSSYRYPYYHLDFPWQDFLPLVDINMPQVYWMEAHNPGGQLTRTLEEFARLEAAHGWAHTPIYPTGSAFCEHGWCATASEVLDFGQAVADAGITGVSWWEWERAVQSGLIDAVEEVSKLFGGTPPPPPPVTLEERVADLERRVTKLENPDG